MTTETAIRSRILLPILLALILAGTPPAGAQSLFAPVVRVNEGVITEWQVAQRARFLDLFRTPGDTRQIAIDRLVEEELQLQAGEAEGISPSPEAIEAGMAEFAGRVDLTTEEFIEAIGQAGVSAEAFRDFVSAGIVWRELVRSRFGPDARPSDAEIEARLLETGAEGGTRVLLSEAILPAGDPQTAVASRARAEELSRITDAAEFAAAAQLFSVAPTRFNGGELDWRPLAALPPEIQAVIRAAQTGRATRPLDLGGTLGVFFVREREEVRAAPPGDIAVEYALLTLPSPEAAASVAARAQTCDDLYGPALSLPGDALRRETVPAAQLPAALRGTVETLNSSDATLLPGAPSTVLMLCARRPNTEDALNSSAVAEELALGTLGARANRLLAELRARATIVRVE